jgi:N-acetylneuraminic acid mutarotase
MRRILCTLVVTALAGSLGACTDDEPVEGGAPAGQDPSPDPRAQVGAWTPLADLPQARTELSAVVLDGYVYAAGGFAQGPSEGFFRYDPAADAWSELAPLPEARHHAPMAAHDGTVYVVAGIANRAFPNQAFMGSFSSTDTLYAYDVASDTWREGPPLPGPVGAHAVATTDNGMIHVLGGIGEHPLPALDQHLVFDTASGNWSTLAPLPTGREHLGAAYLDGVIYTASGRNGRRGTEFEAYDIDAGQWRTLPDVPTARSGVAVVAFEQQIYVFGGETLAGTFDHAERFSPADGTWQEVTPMPSARHGLGGAALDDGIMVIGGGPRAGFSYSADTEVWRP